MTYYVKAWIKGVFGLGGITVHTYEGKLVKTENSQNPHSGNCFQLRAIEAALEMVDKDFSEFNEKDLLEATPDVVIFSDSVTAVAWATKGPKKAQMEPERVAKMARNCQAIISRWEGKVVVAKSGGAK